MRQPRKSGLVRTVIAPPSIASTESSLRASAGFYEGLPVSAARAHELSDYKVVARIHRADVNFLVREDDNAIVDVDGHLLLGVYGTSNVLIC